MAIRSLNGRTSHATLARRIEALEQATRIQQREPEFDPSWETLPLSLLVYLNQYAPEDLASRRTHLAALYDAWEHLPSALRDYVCEYHVGEWEDGRLAYIHEVFEQACRAMVRGDDPLVAAAAVVVRHAWSLLGWHHARVLRAERGMTMLDQRTSDLAARELLGTGAATLDGMCRTGDGRAWVQLWHQSGSSDPAVLAAAGLGEAEVELLESAADHRN